MGRSEINKKYIFNENLNILYFSIRSIENKIDEANILLKQYKYTNIIILTEICRENKKKWRNSYFSLKNFLFIVSKKMKKMKQIFSISIKVLFYFRMLYYQPKTRLNVTTLIKPLLNFI